MEGAKLDLEGETPSLIKQGKLGDMSKEGRVSSWSDSS